MLRDSACLPTINLQTYIQIPQERSKKEKEQLRIRVKEVEEELNEALNKYGK